MHRDAGADTPLLIDETEVERLYGLRRRTLQGWRTRGAGPPFVVCGGRQIRYSRTALEAWIADNTRRSTSDRGPAR